MTWWPLPAWKTWWTSERAREEEREQEKLNFPVGVCGRLGIPLARRGDQCGRPPRPRKPPARVNRLRQRESHDDPPPPPLAAPARGPGRPLPAQHLLQLQRQRLRLQLPARRHARLRPAPRHVGV